jgi:Ser/Thr protein kinase RdoA (MazF antagonist)
MAALAAQGAATFPVLVASGDDWFAAPFYPGPDLTFGDPVPIPVIQDLARLHAAWEGRPPPAGLWTYDAGHVAALAANALAAGADQALAPLGGAGSALARLADRLPRTLVHGDVHPGNIIASPDRGFTLIDWGNAAAAPAMLDVANTVPMGHPAWDAYQAAYRAAGGAVSLAAHELAWRWARGVTALMYLPWTLAHRPAASPGLVAQALEAEAALAPAADRPLT